MNPILTQANSSFTAASTAEAWSFPKRPLPTMGTVGLANDLIYGVQLSRVARERDSWGTTYKKMYKESPRLENLDALTMILARIKHTTFGCDFPEVGFGEFSAILVEGAK